MSVSISGKLKRKSERALLIDLQNGQESQWIPYSQIEDPDRDELEDMPLNVSIDLEISDWIAGQKAIRPVNLERYTVDQPEQPWPNGPTVVAVRDGNIVMCYAPNQQLANMVAAALNLTQGKV